MTVYLEQLDSDHGPASAGTAEECVMDPRVEGMVLPGGWAYPGSAELFATAPVDAAHHDYPAWDWGIPEGTPLYAVRGGHVVRVSDWPYNCFDRNDGACNSCGVGLTVEDDTQTRWTYCHGSQLHAEEGDTVPGGALILASGNTGRSTGPHLHLSVRTADGAARCPQRLLKALRGQGTGIGPQDLPTAGCTY